MAAYSTIQNRTTIHFYLDNIVKNFFNFLYTHRIHLASLIAFMPYLSKVCCVVRSSQHMVSPYPANCIQSFRGVEEADLIGQHSFKSSYYSFYSYINLLL